MQSRTKSNVHNCDETQSLLDGFTNVHKLAVQMDEPHIVNGPIMSRWRARSSGRGFPQPTSKIPKLTETVAEQVLSL